MRNFVNYNVAHCYGNISLVDDQVGRLLGVLAQKGSDKDKLIAFTADHGDHLGDQRLLLKSGVTCYDGSVRVPFLIRYPEAVPQGPVCEELIESINLAPTLLALASFMTPIIGRLEGAYRASRARP